VDTGTAARADRDLTPPVLATGRGPQEIRGDTPCALAFGVAGLIPRWATRLPERPLAWPSAVSPAPSPRHGEDATRWFQPVAKPTGSYPRVCGADFLTCGSTDR